MWGLGLRRRGVRTGEVRHCSENRERERRMRKKKWKEVRKRCVVDNIGASREIVCGCEESGREYFVGDSRSCLNWASWTHPEMIIWADRR